MTEMTEGAVTEIERLVARATIHREGLDQPVAIVPEGFTAIKLDPFLAVPRRVVEHITLNTLDAYIAYVKDWRRDATVIFADQGQRSLRALIDYHEDNAKPQWADHSANYTARLSRQLDAWSSRNGQNLDQAAFADFIEERVLDVSQPSGAELLELATNLQVITKATFGSVIKLASGDFDLKYAEKKQQGSVKVPEKIVLGIPLYHNGPAYQLTVRLRYRVHDGKVVFSYKIVDLDLALEHAYNEIVAKVTAELTGTKVYQGVRKK